jgi:hypothetical protein
MDPHYIATQALEDALALIEELADQVQASFLGGQFTQRSLFVAHLKLIARQLTKALSRLEGVRMRVIEGIALVKKLEKWERERNQKSLEGPGRPPTST